MLSSWRRYMWPSVYWLFFQGVKGKSVKLRCASVKEAEDWKEALEAESAASVDSSTVPEESSATEVLMKIRLGILVVLQTCWFWFPTWLDEEFRATFSTSLQMAWSFSHAWWLLPVPRQFWLVVSVLLCRCDWQCPISTFLPGTNDCNVDSSKSRSQHCSFTLDWSVFHCSSRANNVWMWQIEI